MATDFSKPVATDPYATLLAGIQGAITDLAKGLDPATTGTKTATPTNCIQWNSATSRWEKYNGTSWVVLSSLYAISISGNAATATDSTKLNGQLAAYYQTALGFTPVQQGGGTSQGTNKVYIGWSANYSLYLQVDTTNFGATWPISISGNAWTSSSCSGNAATATNLAASQQANPILGASQSIPMTSAGSQAGSFNARSTGTGDGNLAGMTFWNDSYALRMGVRHDGCFGIGGWCRSVWSWYSDTSGNMVAAGNVTAYSDPRLKENFKPVKDPFSILNQLNGGTFTWRHGIPHTECKAGKRDYGVLASEVKAVMPEIVVPSIEIGGQVYDTVCYEKLVPVLIEAAKQDHERINKLTSLVENLCGQVNALKDKQ